MNYQSQPFDSRLSFPPQEKETGDLIDLERLFRMAWRQSKVVILCCLIGLALGIVYLQTTPSTYTAVSRVLIDEGLGKIVDDVLPATANAQNEGFVLSQIEILRSTRLAGVVADRLKLADNSNFMQPPSSLLAKIIGYVRWAPRYVMSFVPSFDDRAASAAPQYDEATRAAMIAGIKRERAIMMLQGNLMAQRVGRSLVIAVGFQSHDPELATAITRAYADAYLGDQLNASFDATEQAAVWLQGRLAELRRSSQVASMAVEKFKAEHGLASAKGTLITEQQLAELSAQLITSQADTAHALARYEQVQSLMQGDLAENIGSIMLPSDNNANSELVALKTRYQNLTRRQQDIEKNFGADHPQALALAKETASLLEQISHELHQLMEGYRSEYEVAVAREAALRQSVAAASGESAEANQSQVQLRELEQQASALSALYQSFLDRYERAMQQQSFPIAKVRIISEAMRPTAASEPRSVMVLGLSFVLGLMMGSAFGALNEFNERFFRTGEDVADRLGPKFIGYLPLVGRSEKKSALRRRRERDVALPADAAEKERRARMRVTVTAPTSMFAETLRAAKIASDVVLQGKTGKVIGIVSALPGEGKSTVAANFAQLLAGTGARTLVIDGDLRNPGLTRNLGVLAGAGIVDAIVDSSNWRRLLKYDQETGLAILPGLVQGRFSHTAEALTSPGMRHLMEEARSAFDYIVVDLPPLGPVVDAKAFAPMVDGLLVVVEWGRTPRALVRTLLASEPGLSGKVLGVVLSKVELKGLSKYGSFGGSEQFFNRYADYYIETPGGPQKTKAAVGPKKTTVAPAYQRTAQQ